MCYLDWSQLQGSVTECSWIVSGSPHTQRHLVVLMTGCPPELGTGDVIVGRRSKGRSRGGVHVVDGRAVVWLSGNSKHCSLGVVNSQTLNILM